MIGEFIEGFMSCMPSAHEAGQMAAMACTIGSMFLVGGALLLACCVGLFGMP